MGLHDHVPEICGVGLVQRAVLCPRRSSLLFLRPREGGPRAQRDESSGWEGVGESTRWLTSEAVNETMVGTAPEVAS